MVAAPGSWLGEEFGAQAVLAVASAGRFHGRRCRSAWRRFSAATAARGGLRSAPSGDQRFGEEAQDQAVLEEVALAQPDRRRLVRKCAVLQRGGAAEQGTTLRGNCEQGC